jgi:hypothetical protein
MTDAPQFAIVPVPPDPGPLRNLIVADAIVQGDMAAVMQNIIDSRQQRDLRLLVLRGDAVIRAEEAIKLRKFRDICTEIAKAEARMDSIMARKALDAERESLAAELNAKNQQIVDTYSFADDLPPTDEPSVAEPDAESVYPAPEGNYPTPCLHPDPGVDDAGSAPDSDGWLPKSLVGNLMPVIDPKELKHPAPAPPASIDL